jgi:hypothetical protein
MKKEIIRKVIDSELKVKLAPDGSNKLRVNLRWIPCALLVLDFEQANEIA